MQKFKNSYVKVDGRNFYILKYGEIILVYPKWSWWPLWILFQICSYITENLNFLNHNKVKTIVLAASCSLLVSRSPLVTMQPFWTPTNPCLTNTLTSCQFQSKFLTNNVPNFEVLAFISLFCFAVLWNTTQVLPESLSLCNRPQCGSSRTVVYSYRLFIDYFC